MVSNPGVDIVPVAIAGFDLAPLTTVVYRNAPSDIKFSHRFFFEASDTMLDQEMATNRDHHRHSIAKLNL